MEGGREERKGGREERKGRRKSKRKDGEEEEGGKGRDLDLT